MIEPLSLRAMQDELVHNTKLAAELKKKGKGVPVTALFPKIATAGHGQQPQQYEQLSKPRLMQTLKDLPIVVLGTAGGYAIGRTAAEYALPHLLKDPKAQEQFKKVLPGLAAAGTGFGSTMLAIQRGILRDRRDRAAADAQRPPAQPQPETPPKTAGAPTPRVAQGKPTDPWREDRRNSPFLI